MKDIVYRTIQTFTGQPVTITTRTDPDNTERCSFTDIDDSRSDELSMIIELILNDKPSTLINVAGDPNSPYKAPDGKWNVFEAYLAITCAADLVKAIDNLKASVLDHDFNRACESFMTNVSQFYELLTGNRFIYDRVCIDRVADCINANSVYITNADVLAKRVKCLSFMIRSYNALNRKDVADIQQAVRSVIRLSIND